MKLVNFPGKNVVVSYDRNSSAVIGYAKDTPQAVNGKENFSPENNITLTGI